MKLLVYVTPLAAATPCRIYAHFKCTPSKASVLLVWSWVLVVGDPLFPLLPSYAMGTFLASLFLMTLLRFFGHYFKHYLFVISEDESCHSEICLLR